MVTNTAENYKGFCGGWMCLPKIALLDPLMTVSMPPQLTASTGFDALIHGIEAYYHRYKMPQTSEKSLEEDVFQFPAGPRPVGLCLSGERQVRDRQID